MDNKPLDVLNISEDNLKLAIAWKVLDDIKKTEELSIGTPLETAVNMIPVLQNYIMEKINKSLTK